MDSNSRQAASGAAQNIEYAGFWARFAALLVDSAIITVICLAIGVASAFAGAAAMVVGQFVTFAVYLLYWPVMESSSRQATFGKSLLGLQVTDLDGARLSFLRSLLRNIAKIISAIPLDIGFVLAAFTKRKQALHDIITKCLVVRTSPSYFLRAIVAGVAGLLIVAGSGYAYFHYVLVPQMKDQAASATQEAMKNAPPRKAMPARPPLANKPAPATSANSAPKSPGEGSALTGFDKPGSIRVGPAVLSLDHFFPTSIWIKVQLPLIKDIELAPAPEITVTSVLNKSGQNFHDAASPFEKGMFLRAQLSRQPAPVPHFAGLRTLHIKPGLEEKSLQKIEGQLHFTIPADAKPVAFEAADVGKEKTVNNATVALKSLSGAEAALHYRGVSANLLGVRGYAKDGSAVGLASRQLPPAGQAVDMNLQFKFKAPVSKVEAIVAASLSEQKLPFSLAPGSMAGSASTTTAATKASTPPSAAAPEARLSAKLAAPAALAPARESARAAPDKQASASAKPAASAPAPETKMETKPRTSAARPRAPKPAAHPAPAPVVAAAPAYEHKVIAPKFNDVMTAVIYEDEAAVGQLLDLGWWVDKPSSLGFTPLMAAVMRRNTRIAQLLLARGANPNADGPEGVTPLSLARERQDSATAALLIRHGAH